MAGLISNVETHHEDMIHDAQFDYYAKKLATCSSDRKIKVFDVVDDKYSLSATLDGHDGPVWQISWAHPKFGVLLASCSYDGSVRIFREGPQNNWTQVHDHKFHDSSVNSIAWGPHEYGLVLACASSDGKVSILEYKAELWTSTFFSNDTLGCNAISWAPYNAIGSQGEGGIEIRRIVTGSCDKKVRFWEYRSTATQWQQIDVSTVHTDWVRDVAWAPNTAMPYNTVASCSEDGQVVIWKQHNPTEQWQPQVMHQFDAPVWRVSWSVTGNVLAVSTGDHKVSLWKQSYDETWVQISDLAEGETETK